MLRIFVLMIVITLSACGFHLRGPLPLAPAMKELYLKSPDPYGILARGLTQYLKSSGIHLVQKPQDANLILELGPEQMSQQLLSVGGTQQTRQYNLILSVTFQILDKHGKVLLSTQTLTESRTIPIQSNQILAGSNEANSLYNQMRASIIYAIMTRLAAQDTIDILMNVHHETISKPVTPAPY